MSKYPEVQAAINKLDIHRESMMIITVDRILGAQQASHDAMGDSAGTQKRVESISTLLRRIRLGGTHCFSGQSEGLYRIEVANISKWLLSKFKNYVMSALWGTSRQRRCSRCWTALD